MATFSNLGGGRNAGQRFHYKYCYCGRKATVKIVDSEKDSKGKLYFVYERRDCNFWAWCDPIDTDVGFQAWRGNAETECFSNAPTPDARNLNVPKKYDEDALVRRLEMIGGSLRFLTLLIAMCIGLTCLNLLISIIK